MMVYGTEIGKTSEASQPTAMEVLKSMEWQHGLDSRGRHLAKAAGLSTSGDNQRFMYNGTTGRTDGEYKMKDTVYNSNLAVRRGRHPAKAAGLSTSGDSTGWITCCGRPFVLWPSPEVINRTSTKPDDYMIDLIGSERPALDCGDHLRITVLFVKRFFFSLRCRRSVWSLPTFPPIDHSFTT